VWQSMFFFWRNNDYHHRRESAADAMRVRSYTTRGSSETWQQLPNTIATQTGTKESHLRLMVGERSITGRAGDGRPENLPAITRDDQWPGGYYADQAAIIAIRCQAGAIRNGLLDQNQKLSASSKKRESSINFGQVLKYDRGRRRCMHHSNREIWLSLLAAAVITAVYAFVVKWFHGITNRRQSLWPPDRRGRFRVDVGDRNFVFFPQAQSQSALGQHGILAPVPHLHRFDWTLHGAAAYLMEV